MMYSSSLWGLKPKIRAVGDENLLLKLKQHQINVINNDGRMFVLPPKTSGVEGTNHWP